MEAIYYSSVKDNIILIRYSNPDFQLIYQPSCFDNPAWSSFPRKDITNILLINEYELIGYV